MVPFRQSFHRDEDEVEWIHFGGPRPLVVISDGNIEAHYVSRFRRCAQRKGLSRESRREILKSRTEATDKHRFSRRKSFQPGGDLVIFLYPDSSVSICGCNLFPGSMRRGREDDVAVGDAAVVPLKINRPRQFFMAVEGPARDTRDFLLVDDRLAILDDRHEPTNKRDVEGLPETRTPRLLRRRR